MSLLQEVIVLERAWQELVARAGEPEELEVREILGMIPSEWEDNCVRNTGQDHGLRQRGTRDQSGRT